MADEPVVRPGHEDFLAEMLGRGATLPGSCTFSGGRIDGEVIAARYTCRGEEVVIELREPGRAVNPLAHTERFAVGAYGAPVPPDLLAALVARIKARESDFTWSSQADRTGGFGRVPTSSALLSPTGALVGILIAVAAALALRRAWRRGRPRPTWNGVWRGTGRVAIGLLCAAAVALTAEIAYRAKLRLDVHHASEAAFELYGIGESTMVGEPFEPKISVPRLLEYLFRGSIAGRPMVVKNLAERSAPLYPQSAAFERALAGRNAAAPGAVVIMSGHNEGYIPGAVGTWRPYVPNFLADRSAIVRDVLLALRRRRLVDRERSLAAYEYYLRLVIETAQSNGIVPILTTMASNVSRIEPNAAPITPARVAAVIAQGLALEGEGRQGAARDLYLSNLADDSSSAMLYYRAGRCEEALGNFEAAREDYWLAVDRDSRLMFGRATRAQNELVRQLAREYGVPLVDAVQILEEQSPHGIIGDDLFMDGQHPTIAGYLHLANAYARILSERFDTPIRHPLRDEQEAAAALDFGPADLPRALVDAGSWLIATSVYHPFPQDRMALAEKRFSSLVGKGDDFSAWFGVALTQAAARGGMLRSPDDVRALGGIAGYQQSYWVPPQEMPSLLNRFEKFGVDEAVIEQLRTMDAGPAARDRN